MSSQRGSPERLAQRLAVLRATIPGFSFGTGTDGGGGRRTIHDKARRERSGLRRARTPTPTARQPIDLRGFTSSEAPTILLSGRDGAGHNGTGELTRARSPPPASTTTTAPPNPPDLLGAASSGGKGLPATSRRAPEEYDGAYRVHAGRSNSAQYPPPAI